MEVKIARTNAQKVGESVYCLIPDVYRKDNGIEKGTPLNLFVDEHGNLIIRKQD